MTTKNLSEMTNEQIKSELRKRRKNAIENYAWIHKDKRYVALLNEYWRSTFPVKKGEN